MRGVPVDIAKRNPFAMVRIGRPMQRLHLSLRAKKAKRPICVLAKKPKTRHIVMGHIRTKKSGQMTTLFT